MKNAIIENLEKRALKTDIPAFNTGDIVKIHAKIIEGKKERIQIFEGVVVKKSEGGLNSTITVRKVVSGIGVERTFLMHSPKVAKIEVVRFGQVRRARLFYLKDILGSKATRIKEDAEKNLQASLEKAKSRKDEAKKREDAKLAEKAEQGAEIKEQAKEKPAKKEAKQKETELEAAPKADMDGSAEKKQKMTKSEENEENKKKAKAADNKQEKNEETEVKEEINKEA